MENKVLDRRFGWKVTLCTLAGCEFQQLHLQYVLFGMLIKMAKPRRAFVRLRALEDKVSLIVVDPFI